MKTKVIIISLLTVLALLLSTGTAFAANDPAMNLSFQASSGNSAGWVTGPGSSSSEVYLTIDSSAPGSFAVVYVHHTPSSLPSTEPSYSVIGYVSGTPRIWIYTTDGHGAFIYPASVFGASNVQPLSSACSASSLGYSYTVPYSAWLTCETEGGYTVSAVYIIADTSQAVPYTAYITSFQYADVYLIGS